MSAQFKLQLSSKGEDLIEVRVVESPFGEPSHDKVDRPFDPVTEGALLQVLEKQSLDRCKLSDGELAALGKLGLIQDGLLLGPEARNRIIGKRLYDALFPADAKDPNSDVQTALEKALEQARAGDSPFPFQLRFDHDAVALAQLPWELVCDRHERHPVAEGWLRFTRYITFGRALAAFPVADYLDVLVITSRPEGTAYLDPDAERDAIRQAFEQLQASHRVRVRRLDPPTWDGLVRAVNERAYDVVHFDGHGAFARRCPFCERFQPADKGLCLNPACDAYGKPLGEGDLEGCLAFELGGDGRALDLVSANDLATVLSSRRVRLFVASACQTGAVGGRSVFASVGPGLIQAGVPAVVSMQFSVPDAVAADFAAEFYADLARGGSIAGAASAGRRSIAKRHLWHIPAVYLRNRDGEGYLFHRRAWHYLLPEGAEPVDWASLRSPEAKPYKFLSPHEITDRAVFFGRERDTQRVMEAVLDRRYAVLHGPPSVGKTSLVNAGLTPALIDRRYLVLTVRECGDDPVQMLRLEAASSPVLDVDVEKAADLVRLLELLQEAVDRPLMIVFDQFDDFLCSASAERQEAFAEQLAAHARTVYRNACCLLMVLRRGAVGELHVLEAHVPDIFSSRVALAALTRDQARQAIEKPLAVHQPPMKVDRAFLEDTLLPDLCAEAGGDAVSPVHLQIVCSRLYEEAVDQGRTTIGADLYPKEGAREILGGYLRESIDRLGVDKRELARQLLKQMVSSSGERVYVDLARAAKGAGVGPDAVQQVFDALLRNGLLDTLVREDGKLGYSLSHRLLVDEVHGWFDPDEALDGIAQEALDRGWRDWYGQMRAPAREEGEAASQTLLVARDRLAQIRGRRAHLTIDAPQICLLLHSAVAHRCDVAYWASELREHEEARLLLETVQQGRVDALEKPDKEKAVLCIQALGLGRDEVNGGALAKAAVAHKDGVVRHTAALALAALGLDAINEAQATMATAGAGRRRVQALAQMRFAGFPLPQLPSGLRLRVAAWVTGLEIRQERWRILTETLAAGLGAGLGLGLCLLISVYFILGDPNYVYRSLWLQPIGVALGVFALVGNWLAVCILRDQGERVRVAGRIAGFWLGFVLALVVFWLPLECFAQRRSPLPSGKNLFQIYAVGGSLWGLGIIVGREFISYFRPRLAAWQALLGGGLGGVAGCVLAVLLGITVPLVEPSGSLAVQLAEASLAGFGLGGGLAAGWAVGAKVLVSRQGDRE